MTNERTLTRNQLHAVFVEWEYQRRENPAGHGFENFDNGPVEDVATVQVDYVFELADALDKQP